MNAHIYIFSPSLLSSCFGNHLMEILLQLGLFLLHIHCLLRPLCLYLTYEGVSIFLGIMMTDMKIKRRFSWGNKLDFAEIGNADLFLSRIEKQRARPLDHPGFPFLIEINITMKYTHLKLKLVANPYLKLHFTKKIIDFLTFQSLVLNSQGLWMLCIFHQWTVLLMPFAGQNHLFLNYAHFNITKFSW